jgi:hypothetical protein
VFIGDSWQYVIEGSVTDSSCNRGTVMGPVGVFVLPETSRDRAVGAVEMERLSIREFCEGNVEGRFLYCER